jgi:hypothetical protein
MGHGHAFVDDGQRYASMATCKPSALVILENGAAVQGADTDLRIALVGTGGGRQMVEYAVPRDAAVSLAIYDVAGRRVAALEDGWRAAGVHRTSWDTAGVSRGVYFCRIRTAMGSATRSVLVLR